MATARRIAVAVGLALAAGAVMTPAAVAASSLGGTGIGIRLLEAPTDRAGDPRASLYIVDHVAPGARFTRRVEVANGTSAAVDLRLYARPARIEEGRFVVVDDPGSEAIADWVRVTPASLALPAGERGVATVTVTVPADAPAGEHYAAVLAERPAAAPAPGTAAVATRVGVRVYLSVGPGGEPASDFRIGSLLPRRDATGRPVVEARVVNTGGRALDLTGELTLRDGPGRLQAGPFPTQLATTLQPGATAAVPVMLDPALPDGPWLAEIALRSGRVERSAQATITFPAAAGQAARAVTATPVEQQRLLLLPVAAGLLALALLVLALVARRERDRSRPRSALA